MAAPSTFLAITLIVLTTKTWEGETFVSSYSSSWLPAHSTENTDDDNNNNGNMPGAMQAPIGQMPSLANWPLAAILGLLTSGNGQPTSDDIRPSSPDELNVPAAQERLPTNTPEPAKFPCHSRNWRMLCNEICPAGNNDDEPPCEFYTGVRCMSFDDDEERVNDTDNAEEEDEEERGKTRKKAKNNRRKQQQMLAEQAAGKKQKPAANTKTSAAQSSSTNNKGNNNGKQQHAKPPTPNAIKAPAAAAPAAVQNPSTSNNSNGKPKKPPTPGTCTCNA